MNEFIVCGLGASGEQNDGERDRIRIELFGNPFSVEVLLLSAQRPVIDGE